MLREMVMRLLELKAEQDEVCKGCALGKYTKTNFPSTDTWSKGILDLVHSEMWAQVNNLLEWVQVLCDVH